jgi:hypothetical protein
MNIPWPKQKSRRAQFLEKISKNSRDHDEHCAKNLTSIGSLFMKIWIFE